MTIKSNDIMFLLGAGCSFDAKIPTTDKMVDNIENELLKCKPEWKKYESLYYYIKSAILFADGIFGNFKISFSIEKLVNVLNELEKKDRNIIYPFIANWNDRLKELAGYNFENITVFKNLIAHQLVQWIRLENHRDAEYYQGFYDFQRCLEFPIRIFSLNYDLCFEHTMPHEYNLELGFDDDLVWNSDRFDEKNMNDTGIYLYKLHGSITWRRDRGKGNILKLSEVPLDEPDLIFGTDAKLQSIDPYLFYVYEFRKYSLISKIIIIIGYSFNDSYINDIIRQALEHDINRKIICVSPINEPNYDQQIKAKLGINNINQIIIENMKAKEYLNHKLTVENLSCFFTDNEDDIF